MKTAEAGGSITPICYRGSVRVEILLDEVGDRRNGGFVAGAGDDHLALLPRIAEVFTDADAVHV